MVGVERTSSFCSRSLYNGCVKFQFCNKSFYTENDSERNLSLHPYGYIIIQVPIYIDIITILIIIFFHFSDTDTAVS